MPDKKLTDVTDTNVGKMTDNEIKKALECRVKSNCPKCPYFQSYPCDKCKKLDKDTLDLINRLQAKNEALQMDKEQLESDVFNANMNCEHLLEIVLEEIDSQPHSKSIEASEERFRIKKIVDNLLKELVGE